MQTQNTASQITLHLQGWYLIEEGREFRIGAPNGIPGAMTLTGEESTTAERLLYALCKSKAASCPVGADSPEIAQLRADLARANELATSLQAALAECRDAFPTPDAGSAAEDAWAQAMACPECVPTYIRAQAVQLVQLGKQMGNL